MLVIPLPRETPWRFLLFSVYRVRHDRTRNSARSAAWRRFATLADFSAGRRAQA
jgi:hypothetical protein